MTSILIIWLTRFLLVADKAVLNTVSIWEQYFIISATVCEMERLEMIIV